MQYSFYTYLNKETWNQKCTNLDPATKFASVTRICFRDSEMLPLPRESQPYASMPLRLPRRLASKTRKSCPCHENPNLTLPFPCACHRKRCPCHENPNLTLKNWGKPHTKPSFIRLESRFRKESGYSFFQTHPTLTNGDFVRDIRQKLSIRLAKCCACQEKCVLQRKSTISCETFAKN